MNQEKKIDVAELEHEIRKKIAEFEAAESEAKSKNELAAIYKELKELRYQLVLCNKTFHFNKIGY